MNAIMEPVHETTTAAPPEREIVIRVNHVYKRYVQNEYRASLRHDLITSVKRRLSRLTALEAPQAPFYALNDVHFNVHRGEVVGVIGRNGSGKTTLLRLLSGITKPTLGSIEVEGRFAALIALSAGFNMEMTGRRNIYLNSAIQGVKPADVRPIEQDIIDFSELGDFIDLPVKRYSSGMVARLGFSIAIHILPDIVYLDEVLSVGDEGFQRKCSERILQLRDEKRTIVMVSHNQTALKRLCSRVIWLNRGEQVMDDAADVVLAQYAEFQKTQMAAPHPLKA